MLVLRTKQVKDLTFISWVFTLEKQLPSGQEQRYVPILNQGFVFLAAPALALEQEALYIWGVKLSNWWAAEIP